MKHKHKAGFTLVEILVTVIVIVILASLATFAYMSVQNQSRDAKRQADIASLTSELEKFYERNGEYPPACPVASSSCTSWFLSENTSAPLISNSTTLDELRDILPGLASDFGEPHQTSNQPLSVDQRNSAKGYYLLSGAVNNRTSGSSSMSISISSSLFPCRIGIGLNAQEVGSYVVGYYSDKDKQWKLEGGKHGKKYQVYSGGCVIN